MNTRELFGPTPPDPDDATPDGLCLWWDHDWRLIHAESKSKTYGCGRCPVMAITALITLTRPAHLADIQHAHGVTGNADDRALMGARQLPLPRHRRADPRTHPLAAPTRTTDTQ